MSLRRRGSRRRARIGCRGSAPRAEEAGPVTGRRPAARVSQSVKLGPRLQAGAAQMSGLSLRELARQLGVSPSFVSQLENGKSQPSVATLYSISQLLDVSIDELFEIRQDELPSTPAAPPPPKTRASAPPVPAADRPPTRSRVSRSRPRLPGRRLADPTRSARRLSVTRPGERPRLEMDTGVIWEQLATNTGTDARLHRDHLPAALALHERQAGCCSTRVGVRLPARGASSRSPSASRCSRSAPATPSASTRRRPHLFREQRTDRPARGIWFVRHARLTSTLAACMLTAFTIVDALRSDRVQTGVPPASSITR